jgi:hypothetical protein
MRAHHVTAVRAAANEQPSAWVVAGRRLYRVDVHLGEVHRIDPDRSHVRDRAAGLAPLERRRDVVNGIVQPTTRRKFGREPAACRPGDGHHTAVRLEVGALELNYPPAPGD